MSKGIDDIDGIDVGAELESAFAELDSKIPDGYFETFSSKVAATLEREASMQARRDVNQSENNAPPPSGEARDEHSGLHEIKALAQSARKRITKRRSSESDVEASLLSSSSSALSAVVLPDPEAETIPPEPIAVEHDASSSAISALPARPSQGLPTWLWAAGGTALLAAAAAVALLVLNGGDKSDSKVAVSDATGDTAADPAPAPATAAAPAASEPADNKAAAAAPEVEPTVAALPSDEGFADDEAADDGDADKADSAGSTGSTVSGGAARGLVREQGRAERRAEKAEKAKKAPPPPAKPDADKKHKARADETRSEGGVATTGAKGGAEGSGDIDDLLDQVTGKDKKKNKPEETDSNKPDKKRLGTGDVRRAMGGIGGAIKRCQASTGFLGRVSVKFSVAPSGKVSRVKASGGDGKANACVSSAVKSARFPTFEPPAMSFRYSFLLQD